jgi:hypothetical protein
MITNTLITALSRKAEQAHDSGQSYEQYVADLLWEFAATGKVILDDQVICAASAADWLHAVRWIYAHLNTGHVVEDDDVNEVSVRVLRQPRTPAAAFGFDPHFTARLPLKPAFDE